jgi:3-phytase
LIDYRNGYIDEDPEGLTIYKTSKKEGYLIASSQGDHSFNLYNRQYPYDYIGSFKIGHTIDIDNVSDTDGIDVTNVYLNDKYKKGLFVAQDGTNDGSKIVKRQNFKYVSFEDVIKVLNL